MTQGTAHHESSAHRSRPRGLLRLQPTQAIPFFMLTMAGRQARVHLRPNLSSRSLLKQNHRLRQKQAAEAPRPLIVLRPVFAPTLTCLPQ